MAAAAVSANSKIAPWFEVRAVAELGFSDVLAHSIQFSKTGTDFDYVNEGAQDNLYPYYRLSIEGSIHNRHTFIFVYAPLDLRTQPLLERDLVVDDQTFAAGTPMELRYSFPVYRFSYLYNWAHAPKQELALGGTLQLRNAIIDFTSADGLLRRSNRNVGPVPALKFRARHTFDNGVWLGTEIDGIWVNVKYLNGSDEDILGAIVDANARVGVAVSDKLDVFFNLRYFGGGGEGTNTDDIGPGDGYVKNWLHVATVTVGFIMHGLD